MELGFNWVVKDHFPWGKNNHITNILSGRSPSLAQIKLHIKPVQWFEFNYVHGWLISEVVDSIRPYILGNGSRRDIFHN